MSLEASRATLWSAVDMIGRQLVQFAIAVALARMLSPAEFGTFAIAAVFAALITVAVQGVLVTALVRMATPSDADDSALFFLSLLLTVIAAAMFVAIGPALARWYGLPALEGLLVAAAVQLLVQALGCVHGARLNRALRFRELARIGIASTIVGGAAAIATAALGGGVWALAVLAIVPAAVTTLLLWRAEPWVPRLADRAHARAHLPFSAWLAASGLLEVAYSQGIALVIGKLHGAADTGLYNRAVGLQALPASVFSGVVGRVLLPVASRAQHDPAALREGLLKAGRVAMLVYLPLMTGMAMTAEPLIVTLFGQQWAGAAPILVLLALAGAAYPLHVLNLQLLLALGRSDLFFRLETAKKAIGFPALVVGSFYGLMGLAWAQLLVGIAAIFINLVPMKRVVGCGIGAQLANLTRIAAATAVMAALLLAAEPLIEGSAPVRLALLTLVGAAGYGLALLLLRPPALREALDLVAAARGSAAHA